MDVALDSCSHYTSEAGPTSFEPCLQSQLLHLLILHHLILPQASMIQKLREVLPQNSCPSLGSLLPLSNHKRWLFLEWWLIFPLLVSGVLATSACTLSVLLVALGPIIRIPPQFQDPPRLESSPGLMEPTGDSAWRPRCHHTRFGCHHTREVTLSP